MHSSMTDMIDMILNSLYDSSLIQAKIFLKVLQRKKLQWIVTSSILLLLTCVSITCIPVDQMNLYLKFFGFKNGRRGKYTIGIIFVLLSFIKKKIKSLVAPWYADFLKGMKNSIRSVMSLIVKCKLITIFLIFQ